MKKVFSLFVLIIFTVASALTFEEALSAASSRPDAVTKRLELLNAENQLLRVQGDPLALRIDKVQVEQAVNLKQAEYEKAFYDAVVEIAGAYTGILETKDQVTLAEMGAALAQESFEIAEIRLGNGSATALDVQEAQVAAEDARKSVVVARKGLSIALNNLEGMVGQELELTSIAEIPDYFLVALPSQEAALVAIKDHPQLLQTRQGLELAGLSVQMLNPRYASASQIESAKTQLETTEELIVEVQRGFDLQAKNLVIQAENAVESYRIEQESLVNASERLSFQKDRLDAGLIAAVQFEQAQLEFMQAQLGSLQARHAYLKSLLDLQAGTLLEIEGLVAFSATSSSPNSQVSEETNNDQ